MVSALLGKFGHHLKGQIHDASLQHFTDPVSTTPLADLADPWWPFLMATKASLSNLNESANSHLAVAQINVPKWHLGKWNQRLEPA